MRSLPLLHLCLTLLIITTSNGQNDYLVQYEESAATYVDFPTDDVSQALLSTQPIIPKVRLAVWSTVDDLRHPLFYLVKGIVRRLDKDLLIFEPSYYLQDGRNVGCRMVDPLTNEEEENLNNPECRDNCTNSGRYCPGSIPQGELATKVRGVDIVSESLRQLCVWVVYGKTGGDNMLHFFRYVNDLVFEQCDDPFSKNCSYTIMNRIEVSPHFIERCMNHTHGLEEDHINPYLREQIEKGQDITASMIPKLKIGNYWYNGEESTAEIFKAVCAAYPADKQPIACDFCKDCDDVRYCLWHLQCNGNSFEMYAAAKQQGNSPGSASAEQSSPTTPVENIVQAPTAVTAGLPGESPAASPVEEEAPVEAPVASPEDINNDNSQTTNDNSQTNDISEEDKKAAQDALISGILVGLSLGLVVSGVYACRHWQAKLMLHEITKEDLAAHEAKITEEGKMQEKEEAVSPTSAAGMLRRLQDIEAMIDGGKDVEDLLDVVSERTKKSYNAQVAA